MNELQIIIWGVVAQWLAIIGSAWTYYRIRIKSDIRWKADIEHVIKNLDARIGGIEKNRRKEDRFQTVEGCRVDQQSCIRLTEMANRDMGRKINEFHASIDEMRRKSDEFHSRRDNRFDALNAEISAIKEAMSSMAASLDMQTRAVDRMMDHILKGGE